VSIELPKYTIQEKTQAPSLFKKIRLPLGIIIGTLVGYFGNYYFSNNTSSVLRVRNTVLEDLNGSLQDTIAQQKTELKMLKTENKVKHHAILDVQKEFKKLIDDQNELKSDINFYQRLLSPDAENKGLRVFKSKLSVHADNAYSLKLTLVQKLEKAKVISGKVSINVIGKLDKKVKNIKINEKEASKYKFKYFHNLSLMFSLPIGFKAEQLVVKLFPKNKRSNTIEYTVNWTSLIK